MNGLINIFIFGFYNILRFCSLQLQRIALNYLFMVTINNSQFQNIFCKCLSGNLIIAWRVPQNRLDLRRQKIYRIILLFVIIQYVQFCHPNSIRCLSGTRSCVVASSAYFTKIINSSLLSWCDFYVKKLKYISQIQKTEVLVKFIIAYLIHIKTL